MKIQEYLNSIIPAVSIIISTSIVRGFMQRSKKADLYRETAEKFTQFIENYLNGTLTREQLTRMACQLSMLDMYSGKKLKAICDETVTLIYKIHDSENFYDNAHGNPATSYYAVLNAMHDELRF